MPISGDDPVQEKEILRTLVDHGVDGLIAVPTGANGAQLLAMEHAEIPVICAVRRVEGATLESVLAGDLDPALRSEVAHTTAAAIVHRGRSGGDDPALVERLVRLVETEGLDVVASALAATTVGCCPMAR